MLVKIMDHIIGVVYLAAILLGFCSTVAFSATHAKQTRLLIPWAALAAGVVYFLLAQWYFHQPEVLDGGPIRLDIPIIVPFMLYALYVGMATVKKISATKPPDQEKPA